MNKWLKELLHNWPCGDVVVQNMERYDNLKEAWDDGSPEIKGWLLARFALSEKEREYAIYTCHLAVQKVLKEPELANMWPPTYMYEKPPKNKDNTSTTILIVNTVSNACYETEQLVNHIQSLSQVFGTFAWLPENGEDSFAQRISNIMRLLSNSRGLIGTHFYDAPWAKVTPSEITKRYQYDPESNIIVPSEMKTQEVTE